MILVLFAIAISGYIMLRLRSSLSIYRAIMVITYIFQCGQLVCSPKKELLLFGFKLLFFFRIRGAIDGSFVVAFAKWRSSKFPLDNFSYEVVKTSSVSILAFRVGCRPIPQTTFPVLFVLQLFLFAALGTSEFLENILHFTHAPKIS